MTIDQDRVKILEDRVAYLQRRNAILTSQRCLSAWFWFPVHTAHWKLWRLTTARLRATRSRFRELGLALEAQGGEQCKQIARNIRQILESKS